MYSYVFSIELPIANVQTLKALFIIIYFNLNSILINGGTRGVRTSKASLGKGTTL